MKDYIGYEALTQAASRGIIRQTLRKVADLPSPPGDHHFYITFLTQAPGVKMAKQLIERFPEDITIVIQHQYWNFEIFDDHFEIVLKFGGIPQHLVVPFSAITRFVDPSVKFGLAFEGDSAAGDVDVIEGVDAEGPKNPGSETPPAADGGEGNTVVNLDAFRRK